MNQYTGNGTTTNWAVNFANGFLDKKYVKILVLDQEGNPVSTTFSWVDDLTIKTSPIVPAGAQLLIYRDTEKTRPLVEFLKNNKFLSYRDLNTATRQAIHGILEVKDLFYALRLQVTAHDENLQILNAAVSVLEQMLKAAQQDIQNALAAIHILQDSVSNLDTLTKALEKNLLAVKNDTERALGEIKTLQEKLSDLTNHVGNVELKSLKSASRAKKTADYALNLTLFKGI